MKKTFVRWKVILHNLPKIILRAVIISLLLNGIYIPLEEMYLKNGTSTAKNVGDWLVNWFPYLAIAFVAFAILFLFICWLSDIDGLSTILSGEEEDE